MHQLKNLIWCMRTVKLHANKNILAKKSHSILILMDKNDGTKIAINI